MSFFNRQAFTLLKWFRTTYNNVLTEETFESSSEVHLVLVDNSQLGGDELADVFVDLLAEGRSELADLAETSVQTVGGATTKIKSHQWSSMHITVNTALDLVFPCLLLDKLVVEGLDDCDVSGNGGVEAGNDTGLLGIKLSAVSTELAVSFIVVVVVSAMAVERCSLMN